MPQQPCSPRWPQQPTTSNLQPLCSFYCAVPNRWRFTCSADLGMSTASARHFSAITIAGHCYYHCSPRPMIVSAWECAATTTADHYHIVNSPVLAVLPSRGDHAGPEPGNICRSLGDDAGRGQDLRGDAARCAQHGPPRVDHLAVPAAVQIDVICKPPPLMSSHCQQHDLKDLEGFLLRKPLLCNAALCTIVQQKQQGWWLQNKQLSTELKQMPEHKASASCLHVSCAAPSSALWPCQIEDAETTAICRCHADAWCCDPKPRQTQRENRGEMAGRQAATPSACQC